MNPPFVKVSVDVKLLIKDPVRTLLPILSEIPGWELATDQSIEAKQLCGAMTNIIYKCTLKVTDEPVLVRIFGGDEGLFSREDEIRIFAAVAHAGLGPQLRASFINGRVEEFLLDQNLSANQMKTPKVCACVGAAVACFHFTSLPRLPVEKTRNPVPIVWPRVRSWANIVHKLCSQTELEKYQLVNIQEQIDELERDMKEGHPPWLGFCHNDLQYGNMLLHTATPLSLNEDKVRSAASFEAAIAAESVADDFDDAQSLSGFSIDGGSPRARSPARGSSLDVRTASSLDQAPSDDMRDEEGDTVLDLKSKNRLSIRLIDYEYAGYNPVAYDMANHWCEYAADYHTDTPHKLDYGRLPDKSMQLVFVRAYVNAVLALQQHAHPANLTRYEGRPAASDIVSRDLARTLRLRHSFGNNIDHHFHYPKQPSPEPEPSGGPSGDPLEAQRELLERQCAHHEKKPSMRLKPDECVLAAAVTVSAGSDSALPSICQRSKKLDGIVEQLRLAGLAYIPVSHLHWGLWGLMMARTSTVPDFDFESYGLQRLEQYRLLRRDALQGKGA